MPPKSTNPDRLRQYFEHLAGNMCFMHALQIRLDLDKKLLTFGSDPGLANSASHLQLLATRNARLVPESLKEALRATGMVKVVIRDCSDDTNFKQGTLLVDCGNEDLVDSGAAVLSVPVDKSCIIFIDSEGSVALAVLHGKCSQHPDLLTYVNTVIDEAVNDHKGIRPTHGGDLIQFGQNAGPCHARVFGLVNNLTSKKLSMTARQKKDTHALGILALSWNLLVASLPAEAIHDAGLPSMTIKGDNSDSGYTLDLPDGPLCFPSEGYMSQNYES
ncbi:hypothetical protein BDR03DRAFT_986629 [Suillus americanus]|nr:hypothetical protein BDR03DRAFT_986629 [Suillus americanus]